MTAREVLLDGGSPWGFRMNGGADMGHPLRISRVNPGSKAAQRGVREGDVISSINGQPTKSLNNGDSHALLRSVGDSLRLGLNLDTNGSPKRRSKEPLKKETSSGSTQSSPATPGFDVTPESAVSTPDSAPSDLSESTSAGAKVFVCGIWNSVSRGNHRSKNVDKIENAKNETASEPKISETSTEAAPKASSSKARRLRKLKLKSAKREEEAVKQVCDKPKETIGQTKPEESEAIHRDESNSDDQVEVVVVMDEEVVRRAGGVVSSSENYFSDIDSYSKDTSATIVEVIERNPLPPTTTTKSKSKNKNKSKGFLSQIFSSKPGKSQSAKDGLDNASNSEVQQFENHPQRGNSSDEENKLNKNDHVEAVDEIIHECKLKDSCKISEVVAEDTNAKSEVLQEINSKEHTLDDVQVETSKDKSANNPPSTFTIVEIETGPTKTVRPNGKSPRTTLRNSKTVMMQHSNVPTTSASIESIGDSNNRPTMTQSQVINGKNQSCSDQNCTEISQEEDDGRPISIFVVPPDNLAEEAEAPGINWELVSDLETIPADETDDDDVHPEALIHLPSNDLQTSAVIRDGRNGIIQVADYELSVRDLHTPFIDPEEEVRLRCFLETLNLTKPEEYDDTSSSKSLGDSSSASMSGTSPIPPMAADEIVVYRHMKTHSIAEPCFIPPKHQRHLDVITEEVSDPSDSEKRNQPKNPWESSEIIRKNNDIMEIPNDWYGSDEEPTTTSDEGGIDTSWRDGRKLEDVDGVEIVYLSDSDDGDDEESGSKTYDGSISSLENKENVPELVVVHTIDRTDVKSKVKLQPLRKQESKTAMHEDKNNIKQIDEIVAIIDSTFEINKDLFSIQPQIYKPKVDTNQFRVNETPGNVKRFKEQLKSNFFEDPDILVTSQSRPLDVFYSDKYNSTPILMDKKQNVEILDGLSIPQEKVVLLTSPPLSRQGSSSSATSQSTAKYNPGQSPMSSEAEDKSEKSTSSKQKKRFVQKTYNPKSLTTLSKEAVANNSFGEFYLKKIGFSPSGTLSNGVIEGILEVNNGKITSLPPSGVSTRRSSFHELENIYSTSNYYTPIEAEHCPSQPIFVPSPPTSSLATPPLNDNPWMGVPTSTDPRLLVCFSPSQSKDTIMASSKEATELLDLHQKFMERRGYHESSKRNSICSPKSERSCTPDLCSPDLIRLEPYESKRALEYTPELLKEAANLLALKEYRRSRFRSAPISDRFKTETTEINGSVLKKNGGLSGVTSPRTEINGDSEDSNRSAGTSRLLALLQDRGAPCSSSNDTAPGEMERVDKSECKKPDRVHSGSYISEWLTMTENVISNSESATKTDFNKNVIDLSRVHSTTVNQKDAVSHCNMNNLNMDAGVERRQFEADMYKISKQGDIAIIQTKEDTEMKPKLRNDRPKSVPTVGVPALSPTGGEVFREKMYHEYMSKVAERSERRQQKVIRISSRPSSVHSLTETEVEKPQNPPVNQLESEFLSKARERMSKLGINLDQEPQTEQADEEKPEEELPKHLQEFIELTTAPQVEAVQNPATGVWSPGATPEAQRKQFDFSELKEEPKDNQEDSEPVPPVWTPKSAQASPVLERKFRSVNFESPKSSRKTYNKPAEGPPKPPTDLPLQLDSPSHSQTSSSVSSSTQYLSSARETTTSTHTRTQESSGRLVTSHSLPDTCLDSKLPRAQNPTITLLQKAREGQLPRGAHYLDENLTNSVNNRSSPPAVRPNDILYSVRREHESETDEKSPKRVEIAARKVDGIGPTTKEGIPVVLRSEVQDENQQKWYKRMYDSLHRAEKDSRLPYASAGYQSEPEPVGSYDSDYASAKYATLDRRRIRNKDSDFTTSTMPRTKYNAVKHGVDIYKNQPGRIEDYEPGHSSIADKEAKQWWDEVMDIFDGQFEQTQKSSPRTHAPATSSTNKPFMTYALKESGYESDSTLVFKRRDETQQQLSPAEQRQAYKTIQKGGEVPLHGLRKPVPDKPKESPHRYVESEVTIHYRSPVRSEEKEAWSEEELQRRQAEAMRRIYQEERRRKYLQELQDMYSRRHTDNFTPSQKSPIPLNRYDDFVDDLSPGKPRDRTPEPKLVARALYNFVGQTSRELTFRRGDIIYVRRQIDKNWYEGEHNAMIGLFPFNYVEIIPYDGIRTLPKRPTEGQARAKFNFQAQTHLELPLVKGELLLLTRRVDQNWFEGRIGNRKGIFPVSYVDVLVEPGERAVSPVRVNTPTKPVASPASHSLHMSNNMSQHHYQPPRPVSYTSLTADLKQPPVNQTLHIDTQNEPVPYRVLYNYKPQNEDELELVEGETVYVMEKCDDGWYVGSSQRTGYLGTFPGNYVERQV